MPSFSATRSRAHEVGIERAQPLSPAAKYGMQLAFATMMASESLGEQKKRDPMIMLRSASPSAAAPKTGGSHVVSTSRPSLLSPILATSSTACVRFGSAWPCDAEAGPPKSSFGSQFISDEAGAPNSSTKIFLAYGPCTPCIPSYTKVKSLRAKSALMAPKSKTCLSRPMWSSTQSKTSTRKAPPPSVYEPGADRSISGRPQQSLYSLMVVVLV
mmetsp:Transcript_40655/g.131641  ORF Transcript_40655/g.131641 Transcript_40655/m.131641 type:complete len:214 (+) Transcript_40655:951-1592(+)